MNPPTPTPRPDEMALAQKYAVEIRTLFIDLMGRRREGYVSLESVIQRVLSFARDLAALRAGQGEKLAIPPDLAELLVCAIYESENVLIIGDGCRSEHRDKFLLRRVVYTNLGLEMPSLLNPPVSPATPPTPDAEWAKTAAKEISAYLRREYDKGFTYDEDQVAAIVSRHFPASAATASLLPFLPDGTPSPALRASDNNDFAAWWDSRVNKNATPEPRYVWNAACAHARREAMKLMTASAATGDKERATRVSSDESGVKPNTYTVGFQGGFLRVVLDRDAETADPMAGDIYRLPLKRIMIPAAEQLEAAIEAALSADAARKPDGGEGSKP